MTDPTNLIAQLRRCADELPNAESIKTAEGSALLKYISALETVRSRLEDMADTLETQGKVMAASKDLWRG